VTRRVNRVGVKAIPKESKQQEMLFEWMSYIRVPVARMDAAGNLTATEDWVPLTDIAYAVPNGTSIAGTPKQRAMYMAALKRQGFKVGVSDIVIPFPTVARHGLYLELKRDKTSKVSKDQKNWRLLMRRLDYRAEIAVGFDEAKTIIEDYLRGMYRTVSRPASKGLVV
jgi:hypothetical protein